MIRHDSDPARRMAVAAALGSVVIAQGEFTDGIALLQDGLELSRVHWHDGLVGTYASDLRVVCASSVANGLLMAGFPDRGFRRLEESLRVGEERSHPIAAGGAL